MGIVVRDAMNIGGLTGCKVVAGEKGLEREIEYITVMEVPDVIRWLKGNVLLLTSLFPIKGDEDAIRCLVQQLADIGSAALAIKTHRFIEEIPEIIIAEGNRLNFPIIEIDNEVSYLDIMTPLMRYILKKPAAEQENLDMFFQWVTELAMGGKGIPAIVQAVEHVTGNLITVESEFSFIEGIVHKHQILPLNHYQKNELRTSKRSIRMTRKLNDLETSCIVTPLLLKDELYGYVTCWQTSKPFREQDFVILDRIISLLALEFLKAKTEMDVVQTYKDECLKDILMGESNEEEEVIASARKFGWDLTKDFQVFVVCFDNPAFIQNDDKDTVLLQRFKMSLLQRMTDIMSLVSKTTIVGLRKDTLVMFYPVDAIDDFQENHSKKKTVPIAEQILKQLKQSFDDNCFTIGIGRFHKGIRGIQSAYSEAANAAQLGKAVWGKGNCIHYDDLGIYRILGQFHDRKELESLYAESIGKIVDFDRNNQSRLLETLSEYFHNNYILTETAERLFIHVNSLKYRLQKIELLTGCSISKAEERLRLHIGLKIQDILNNPI